jgi:hypothetical protein
MRFRGGGVGHKATNTHTSILQDTLENNPAASINDVATAVNIVIDSDELDARLVEEEDYGYSVGDGSEDENEDEEVDDMGAEDGEEPWDMDDLEAEGYGAL